MYYRFNRKTSNIVHQYHDINVCIMKNNILWCISMCNQMVTSEIIPLFHDYTIWLPINIIGDKLRLQSWVSDLFIVSKTPRIQMFKAYLRLKITIVWIFRQKALWNPSCCLQNVLKLSQLSNLRYMIRYNSSWMNWKRRPCKIRSRWSVYLCICLITWPKQTGLDEIQAKINQN